MSEPAAQNDLIIRLEQNCRDKVIRSEAEVDRRINGAIGIQPGDAMASDSTGDGELAGQKDSIIRLKNDARNGIIRAEPRMESGIGRTIRIQASNARPCEPIDIGEQSADKNPLIGLK